MTTRKGRRRPQLRAARRGPPLPSCPSPPGGEEHPLLNPRQGRPQPRIARARVGPGTTAPQGPRPRKHGAPRGSEPAPEVTGLPASPFSTHTPTQLPTSGGAAEE